MSKLLQLYIGGGYGEMITVLHRGGMPKWLQYYIGGEVSLRTPKSDYIICARPLTGKTRRDLNKMHSKFILTKRATKTWNLIWASTIGSQLSKSAVRVSAKRFSRWILFINCVLHNCRSLRYRSRLFAENILPYGPYLKPLLSVNMRDVTTDGCSLYRPVDP